MTCRLFLAFIFSLCWVACAIAQDGGIVTLRPSTEVKRAAIRLSDVFEGVSVEQDRDIAIAPGPGKSVTYEQNVLTRLSEQYRLGWTPGSLADRCVLTRAATRITPEMVGQAVLDKVKALGEMEKGKVEVVFDTRQVGLALPAESGPIFDLTRFDYDRSTRRFRADLVSPANGSDYAQSIVGHLSVKRDVPVLTRRLSTGTTLSEGDLSWISEEDSRIGEDILMTSADIVGRELRHDVAEGEKLRARDVMPPRLVTRGAIVTMKVETPSMLITAQGRALQDGAKGETVRVTNLQSNKVVEGTVEAAGVVRIGGARKMNKDEQKEGTP